MRPIVNVAFAALLASCATPQARPEQPRIDAWATIPPLGNLQIALLHARLTGAPTPYEDIAGAFLEIQTAANEFQRRDRLVEVRTTIDRASQDLDRARTFATHRSYPLPDYDFAKHGFPLPLNDGPFVMISPPFTGFRSTYAVVLTNGSAFAFMPVAEADARWALGRDFMRGAQIDLEVEPVSADTRPIAGLDVNTRVIMARVARVRLTSQGRTLGVLGSPSPSAVSTSGP